MSNLSSFAENGKKIVGVVTNYKNDYATALRLFFNITNNLDDIYEIRSLIKALKIEPPNVPGIFIKPSTSYIQEGTPIMIPKGFSVNQEVELGVVIGKKAQKISENEAMGYVGGYCVGLDMTAVNIIREAKSKGGSWTIAKGFDTAAPVSKFIPKSNVPDPYKLNLWCSVNGKLRQDACVSDLYFNIAYLISFISRYITLEPNDMILTGAPPNFGPVHDKDVITCGIKNLVEMKFDVIEEK